RQRRLELHVLRQKLRQRPRVEALPGRDRVLGVVPDGLRSERDEPLERLVEPVVDEPLQALVAAGTLEPELLPLEMPPDHAAREEHRAAGSGSPLDQPRSTAELARPRGADEAGHAGSGDQHTRITSARTSACARRTRRARARAPRGRPRTYSLRPRRRRPRRRDRWRRRGARPPTPRGRRGGSAAASRACPARPDGARRTRPRLRRVVLRTAPARPARSRATGTRPPSPSGRS